MRSLEFFGCTSLAIRTRGGTRRMDESREEYELEDGLCVPDQPMHSLVHLLFAEVNLRGLSTFLHFPVLNHA